MASKQTVDLGVVDCTEQKRLSDAREAGIPWKKWGPYLSERQWGTVREDSSQDGNAWDCGLGASHQTGWTGLIARILDVFGRTSAKDALETPKEKLDARVVRQHIAGD